MPCIIKCCYFPTAIQLEKPVSSLGHTPPAGVPSGMGRADFQDKQLSTKEEVCRALQLSWKNSDEKVVDTLNFTSGFVIDVVFSALNQISARYGSKIMSASMLCHATQALLAHNLQKGLAKAKLNVSKTFARSWRKPC